MTTLSLSQPLPASAPEAGRVPALTLASLSTAGLLSVLGMAALLVLITPGQPLAALMGIQACGMGG